MKVIVAVPSYKCANQIQRVLADFDQILLDRIDHIIVIDNQSVDGTIEKAIASAKFFPMGKIVVVRNGANYGLGGTHKVALLYAESQGADYLAIVHGDHQAKSSELNLLLDVAEKNLNCSAVLGARFIKGSRRYGYSLLRTYGNFMLNAIYSVLTLRVISDMGSGLNLFRIKDLQDHRYLHFNNNFTFNHDLLLDYCNKGLNLDFVPITWTETDQISNAKTFSVGWIALKTVLFWRFNKTVKFERTEGDFSYEIAYP